MNAAVVPAQGTVSAESAARIAEGVEAVTGHGGAVEAHPSVTPGSVASPESVVGSSVPVTPVSQPTAAPAGTIVNVNVPSK